MTALTEEAAKALRAPFDPSTIGKLPRVTCRDCSQKSCAKHQKAKCRECDAYISTAHIHLDYVGHAAVTDRLLQVDAGWSWEPFGLTADGLPALTTVGGETSLWIRLTVCGVTRPAVGTASSGSFELPKQLISDAIRNGAMRFGVALDLWSKEDLSHDDVSAPATQEEVRDLIAAMGAIEDMKVRAATKKAFVERFGAPSDLLASRVKEANDWLAERPYS